MNQYCIGIGDLVSPFSNKMEQREATILYSTCYLSVHLKAICQAFNIQHPLCRVGWIVDPVKILSPIHPKLNVSASLKSLIKSHYLLTAENPFRVIPNPDEIGRLGVPLPFTLQNINDNVFYAEHEQWATFTNQEYWDHIPGVSDGLPPVTLKKYTENVQDKFTWAKQYKLLDNAPDYVIDIARIVADMTGFVPDQKDYLPAYLNLYEASGKNIQTLREGIQYALNQKTKDPGLMLLHPRSFIGFVKTTVAYNRVTDQSIPLSQSKRIRI